VKHIGRLHVLTDVVLQDRFSHLELTAMAISGGADTIQFRQKNGSTRELIEIAKEMRILCSRAGVIFIVNDRIDIAIASGADGVHLGQDDFPISLARDLLGHDRIIGGSASSIEEARKCLSEGVDYIGFGPIYRTKSKHDAGPPCGIHAMKQAINEIPLPFIAIGGVDSNNIHELIRAGAHGIAVISAVCCKRDPEKATRALKEALNYGSNIG